MSNVVQLFKDEEETPAWDNTPLSDVMSVFTDWAAKQGADVNSTKFLYECATIMTLMQIAAGNK